MCLGWLDVMKIRLMAKFFEITEPDVGLSIAISSDLLAETTE